MRVLLFVLALSGCGQNALPACDCPVPPNGGPDGGSAPRDLSAGVDLAVPADLFTVIDLARGDGPVAPELFEILPNTPMRVGDTVKLLGRGFGCANYCYVQLGGSYAQLAAGADDFTISFVVPSLSLPANGSYLELTVWNSGGSARQQVTVLPAPVSPSGRLDLLWRDVGRASLDVGVPTVFHFTVRSGLNQPLPVAVTATTTNGLLPATVVDAANGQPLQPGASRDFLIQLNPQSGNVALSLNVRAAAGAIQTFFSATGLQVGAPLPPQDFALDLHAQSIFARSAVDDLIAVEQGGAAINLLGELHSAGTWTLDAQLSSPDWTLHWQQAAPVQMTASAADVMSAPAQRAERLTVAPLVPSPAPAFLTVTAQQSGAAAARTLRYRLLSAE